LRPNIDIFDPLYFPATDSFASFSVRTLRQTTHIICSLYHTAAVELYDIMEDGTYTAATAAFVKWLQTSGTSVSDKIDLVDMRDQGAGRGVGTMHRVDEQRQGQD
jgi:hypothetical protein